MKNTIIGLGLASLLCSPVMAEPPEPTRVVTVGVYNDYSHPVDNDLIDDLLDRVSAEYEEKTGIQFVPVYETDFVGIDIWYGAPSLYLDEEDPAEIHVIFTNYSFPGVFFGIADEEKAVLILYETEAQPSYEGAGEEEHFATLRHELGHLFSLDHCRHIECFMYLTADDYGEWSEHIVEELLENKYKVF